MEYNNQPLDYNSKQKSQRGGVSPVLQANQPFVPEYINHSSTKSARSVNKNDDYKHLNAPMTPKVLPEYISDDYYSGGGIGVSDA